MQTWTWSSGDVAGKLNHFSTKVVLYPHQLHGGGCVSHLPLSQGLTSGLAPCRPRFRLSGGEVAGPTSRRPLSGPPGPRPGPVASCDVGHCPVRPSAPAVGADVVGVCSTAPGLLGPRAGLFCLGVGTSVSVRLVSAFGISVVAHDPTPRRPRRGVARRFRQRHIRPRPLGHRRHGRPAAWRFGLQSCGGCLCAICTQLVPVTRVGNSPG